MTERCEWCDKVCYTQADAKDAMHRIIRRQMRRSFMHVYRCPQWQQHHKNNVPFFHVGTVGRSGKKHNRGRRGRL